MSLLRSERMGFYTLVMPKESAIEILDELGSVSLLQFIDPEGGEANFKRDFTLWVRRCEELTLKLASLAREMHLYSKPIFKTDDYKGFLDYMSQEMRSKNVSHMVFFDQVEQLIEEKLQYFTEQTKKFEEIKQNRNNLVANRVVLIKAKKILLESKFSITNDLKISETPKGRRLGAPGMEIEMREIRPVEISNVKLSYMIGVIPKEETQRFKRMLFRVTKGNIFNLCEEISEEILPLEAREDSSNILNKAFFIIIYRSGESGSLDAKLGKICESFGATRFDMPKSIDSFNKRLEEIDGNISDTENLYSLTKMGIETLLEGFSELNSGKMCSLIEEYRMYVAKEKHLFQNMNLLREKNHIYHGFCWIPRIYEEQVMSILRDLSKTNQNIVSGQIQEATFGSLMKPPTYFRTNEFTYIFQEIVNTYGTPRYREINPGLFTIVLFPFLYGVMFGDVGHGFIVFVLGCYLMMANDTIAKENSPLKGLLSARYLFALMGFFACYCGFIYNDMMSLNFNFGSCFYLTFSDGTAESIAPMDDCYYPFGVDPAWTGAENELSFYNSLKMKLAVIIGVLQMLFGVVLKGLNNINDRKPLDFFFEFVPQFLLMSCLFGYMDLLIVIKWLTDWTSIGVSNAPSIITIMIDIPLSFGAVDGYAVWGDDDQESEVQEILLIVIVVCAIVMLTFKPAFIVLQSSLTSNHKPKGHQYQGFQEEEEEAQENSSTFRQNEIPIKIPQNLKASEESEHSSTGEIFIYQTIETIEFVLGAISNTASYLRLWALSLAHSQLSSVFFSKILEDYIVDGDILMMTLAFFVFANVSFAVLMCMDSMECFLHALRLQWVEFQSKFFKADGYKFIAFSFPNALAGSDHSTS